MGRTSQAGGVVVKTAVVVAAREDGRDRGTAAKNLSPKGIRTPSVSSCSSSFTCRVILPAAVAAIKLGLAEGTLLVDLPSGLKCAWYNLPHPAQYAILLMMLGCLYGVNRVFDKLDKAMYARLSCATGNYMRQRRGGRRSGYREMEPAYSTTYCAHR
ncbi:unnamed protein product [Ectocarpus sp. 12 AP-2014]